MASVVRSAIEPHAVCAEVLAADAGAVATFAGTVRDEHNGRAVTAIDYHAYENMALKELAKIETEARRRWPVVRMAIVHRLGLLEVGDTSVFLAVAAPHRVEAFAALRFGIDTIKETVPIWKKEIYVDGYAWIEGS